MKFDKNQAPYQRIKLLRIAKDMKQSELAEKVGVDQQSVSDWEVGKHVPSDYYQKQIAAALDVKITDIWG